jgi:hypothetical protein
MGSAVDEESDGPEPPEAVQISCTARRRTQLLLAMALLLDTEAEGRQEAPGQPEGKIGLVAPR